MINFFKSCFVSPVKFSYWSRFHVNIITGSGVIIIFFNKGLTRNPEIPPSEFCPLSEDWGKLGIQNLARMSLIKCYWMLQNARVTGFTISELLRGKTTKQRRGVKLLSSTQIRVLGNTDNPHVLFNEVKSTRSCKDMSVNFVSLLEIYCKAWWNHFKIQLNCEHA